MRSFIRRLSLSVLLVVMPLGCAPTESGGDSELLGELEGAQVLTCSSLSVARGGIGSGQSVSALATARLTGVQDSWREYVEFAPGSSVSCTFRIPEDGSVRRASGLVLRVNYRGPVAAEMLWTFEVYDEVQARWLRVGDNGFARDWRWTRASLPLPVSPERAAKDGSLRLRYSTSSSVDASLLDELVVVALPPSGASDAGTPPPPVTDAGAPSLPTPDAGTPPPPPPPADAGTSGPASGIWRPAPGTSWQWQLTGTIDTSLDVTMYDIDLFDASTSVISSLKARGRVVICYFSAGSYENWRPDASRFPAAVLGNQLDGWPGERWLDTRSAEVRAIMAARMDLAASKGCTGVEPDNIDGYTNGTGFPLTAQSQIDYNRFLAREAHARGLSIGLKNDLDQVSALVGDFDWALNEECNRYSECELLSPFTRAGKAVFHVEYGSEALAAAVCPKTRPMGFSTLIKKLNLDAWRVACP